MRRHLPLYLLALLIPACAAVPPTPETPAARHVAQVAAADEAAGRMLDHLALRERTEIEQAASLRFAAGGAVPRNLPDPAVPVAGAVLDPAMDLVLIQAQRLAALASGTPAGGDAEAAAAFDRLQAAVGRLGTVPARWPSEAIRRRGLDAFRALSQPVPAGVDAGRLAADRQGAMQSGIAFLQAVMGADARSGLRGVLAQRHEAWRGVQRGLLEAARTDRNLTPQDRLAMWNRVQATLAGDPPDLAAAEVVTLLGALPTAHAAAGAADAAGLAPLDAALARFRAILAQAR